MPYLAFNLNDGNEFVFDLLEDRLSIGRASGNDIVIDSGHISGFHAEFKRQPDGGYEVVDLKSSNGTFVNDRRIERALVKNDDRIKFGGLESRFRDRSPKDLATGHAAPSPASTAKSPAPREDGRRGDTEGVPLDPARTVPIASPPPKPDPEASRATARVVIAGVLPPAQIPKPADELEAKTLSAEITALAAQRETRQKEVAAAEARLAEVNQSVQSATGEFKALQAQKAALGDIEEIRKATAEEAQKLERVRKEATELEALHKTREAELAKAISERQKELSEAEGRLKTLTAREADITRKFSDVSSADTKLKEAGAGLTAVEQQRSALEAQKNAIATAILNLTAQHRDQEHYLEQLNERGTAQHKLLQSLATQQEEATARASQTEAAQSEAAAKLATLAKEFAETETKLAERQKALTEAEAAIEHASAEEKRLKKELPELKAETAATSAVLARLVAQRDEMERTVTILSADNEASECRARDRASRARELESQVQDLAEDARIREEGLQSLQTDVDRETQRLKVAQDGARIAEAALAKLHTDLEMQHKTTETARQEAAGFDSELSSRSHQVSELKAETERLHDILAARREDLLNAEKDLAMMEDKVRATEQELLNITLTGGKASTIADALKSLESLHVETQQLVRSAAEQELALQAKINTIQETSVREKQRMEQLKQERAKFEEERAKFEEEQQKRQEEARARIHELQRRERQAQAAAEAACKEHASLEQRVGDLHEAGTLGDAWGEVERRVRGQLEELEEKHEILRLGLNTDEATVMMFANDLIKRIDLIDILIQRCAGSGDSTMEQQLRTLRASFEDIMHQHGVTEFDVEPGTELDVELRQRIAVIESQPGDARPKVVATCRPGFIYTPSAGREVVLRKVEVTTTSL